MLKLVAVCGFLTIALSFDFGGMDEATYESALRDQGFSEEDIQTFLQEHREARAEGDGEGEFVPWHVARGYHECEEFKKRRCGYNGFKCTGCLKPRVLSDICEEYDCPIMESLGYSACGFEARDMPSSLWATTDVDMNAEDGFLDAFWRLWKYINKSNRRGVRMAKTVYMVKRYFMDGHKATSANMAFYIPADFQDNPPTPTDSSVSLEEWGEVITYSRAFGGERSGDEKFSKMQFRLLKKALEMANIPHDPEIRMTFEDIVPGCAMQRNEVTLFALDLE